MSSVTFLYLLKTSENRRFSDVFRGYKSVTLIINGLKGCINDIFSHICCGEISQIQKKTGIEWSISARHLKEVRLNGLPYWLTGIFTFFKSYSEALQREKNQLNCILRHWPRNKCVFKIWEFIIITINIIKSFPTAVGKMPQEHLQKSG